LKWNVDDGVLGRRLRKWLLLVVLATALFVPDAGWAGSGRLAGVSFETPGQVAATVTLLNVLCGDAARLPDELTGTDTKFVLHAGFFGLLRGEMNTTIRRSVREGLDVVHIHQEARIGSREQVDDSYVDAASALPLEHVSRIRRPDGELVVNTLLWDHLGGRLFVEKTRKKGEVFTRLQRREYRLGEDVPAGAVDPLTALLLYRGRCIARKSAEPWSTPVVDASLDIYDCSFRLAGTAGTDEVVVEQSLLPRNPSCDPAMMSLTMNTRAAYLPVRFSGTIYGLKASAVSQGRESE
jgi:hypothetical protein